MPEKSSLAARDSSPRRLWAIVLMLGLALVLSWPMSGVVIAQTNDAEASREDSSGFIWLSSTQLATMMQEKDIFLVNVHIPYEGEIRGSDAHIAFDKIAENLDKLPPDRSARIVLYCRSGRMSEIAAEELVRLGYSNVSHLAGGMIDWKNNGYEIIEE